MEKLKVVRTARSQLQQAVQIRIQTEVQAVAPRVIQIVVHQRRIQAVHQLLQNIFSI